MVRASQEKTWYDKTIKRRIKVMIAIFVSAIILLSFIFSKSYAIYIIQTITPLVLSLILWRASRKIKELKNTIRYIKNVQKMLLKASIGIWLGGMMVFFSVPYIKWAFLIYGSGYYGAALAKMLFFLIIGKNTGKRK